MKFKHIITILLLSQLWVVSAHDRNARALSPESISGQTFRADQTHRLFFPVLGVDESWEARIRLISHDDTLAISGALEAFDADGFQVSDTVPVILAPNKRLVFRLDEIFSNPRLIRHVIFQADSDKAAGCSEFQSGGLYRASAPAVADAQIPTSDIPIAHIASNDLWKTFIFLLNTTDQFKQATLVFDSGETVTRNLAPLAHDRFFIRDIFDSTPRPELASARIIDGSGIIAGAYYLNMATMQFDGIVPNGGLSTRMYFPHVGKVPTWGTWIVAHNPSAVPAQVTIGPYNAAGNRLVSTNFTLEPYGKYIGAFSRLNLPKETAWFEMEADRPITGFELFSRQHQLGGVNSVTAGAKSALFPKIDHQELSGIALVNVSPYPARVILSARDDDGQAISQQTLNLMPHEKVLGLAENLFTGNISDATHIRFDAEQEMAGLMLDFTSDGQLLDALLNLPISSSPPTQKDDWTYMVYMAGDNNLSGAVMKDINEMEMVGSSDRVNIVVQVEFSPLYSPGLDTPNTLRGRITRDLDDNAIGSDLADIGQVDMGNPESLTEFIRWAAQNYPAEHFALVIRDHGHGWKSSGRDGLKTRALLYDDSAGSHMSFREMADAVRNSAVPLGLIDFDANLMAMYEVCAQMAGLSDFLVFSEQMVPGDGNPYHLILEVLSANPDITPYQLAGRSADRNIDFYRNTGLSRATKSAADLGYVRELDDSMRALAQLMIRHMDTQRALIEAARNASLSFQVGTHRDLIDFLNRYESMTANGDILTAIQTVRDIASSMVIANHVFSPDTGSSLLDATGLSVYIPRPDQVADVELFNYGQLAVNDPKPEYDQTWGNFVNLLVTGNTDIGPIATAEGNFTVRLEWEGDADLDLIIEEPTGLFAAPYLGPVSDNGFMSEDSNDSGLSVEYYSAARTVQAGTYKVYVNYFEDGATSGTTARVYLFDPVNGIKTFMLQDSRFMDLSNTAPVFWFDDPAEVENVRNDVYSDWWVPKSNPLPVVRP